MKNVNRKTKITLKNIFVSILLITVFFNIVTFAAAAPSTDNLSVTSEPFIANDTAQDNQKTDIIEVLSNTPLQFSNLEYEPSYDLNFCYNFLVEAQEGLDQLKAAIVSGNYTAEAFEAMYQEVNRLETIVKKVQSDINKIKSWEKDYYYAAKTWEFLIKQGYSEVVSSAIIGNMMIETSGGSLALKPTVYDHTGDYYGLCQWSLYYRPEVADMSFEEQLEYLVSDIEKEFNTFGNYYAKGFTFEDFLAMKDPAKAAKVFAMVYERCDSNYYNIRMQAALTTYDYFSLI